MVDKSKNTQKILQEAIFKGLKVKIAVKNVRSEI